MGTILVTGGCGFIGSNFVRFMLRKYDYKIINVDKLTYAGNLENLSDISDHPNYEFVRGDIADKALIEGLASKGIGAVINFAAESHVDRSIEDPRVFIETNVLGTQVLLEAARKYGILRFIQISTDEVYGSLGTRGSFKEASPLAPNSPYSASKTAADLLVRAYYKTYGLAAIITRCSNNYGPYQFPEKLIPLMISNALEDKSLPVYGDGMNVRDWIYVEDHCRAIELIMHRGKGGEVYNIGANNELSNIEIVKIILKKLNKPESLIKFVEDRPGHDRRYAIDSTKLRNELGWDVIYPFEKAIDRTIRWYVEHQDWWKKIKSGEYLTYYERMYGHRL
ncbi:MAG: dTDP-glucose 4,6-dehydratase [Syntrophobacterales bacterium]|nr:MAG: dTDP-glucose 4,6-dehydratase [Syntrophobacterales bacterium]